MEEKKEKAWEEGQGGSCSRKCRFDERISPKGEGCSKGRGRKGWEEERVVVDGEVEEDADGCY